MGVIKIVPSNLITHCKFFFYFPLMLGRHATFELMKVSLSFFCRHCHCIIIEMLFIFLYIYIIYLYIYIYILIIFIFSIFSLVLVVFVLMYK